jgi:hypothetical protein
VVQELDGEDVVDRRCRIAASAEAEAENAPGVSDELSACRSHL